jgi:hypothetical protein
MSIFEAVMLLCFGAAWPVSIYKSWTSRVNGGKSVWFLFIILIGYVSGCLHKLLYSYNAIIWLYALNGVMVLADILLYWRNARLGRGARRGA